jgi:hypothetical protein
MALLLATYRVRPATRTWLGAGSPSAAATKDGAAIDEPDSTAQSVKNVLIRSPRLVLKILTTSRSPGLSSCARSAAWKLPRSSWPSSASARAEPTRAAVKASLFSSVRSITRTRGRPAIRGPRPWSWDRSRTVTAWPYRVVSSSATRQASASSPHTMRWSRRAATRDRGGTA